MLLLTLYFFHWLAPHYGSPNSVLIAFLAGVTSVLFVAWIPDTTKVKRRFHLLAAYCVVASQAVIIGSLLTTAALSTTAWLLAWLMLLLMFAISYALFFKANTRQVILALEVVLFMSFPAALAAMTYL